MSSREVEPVELVTDPMEMIATFLSEIDLSLKVIVGYLLQETGNQDPIRNILNRK